MVVNIIEKLKETGLSDYEAKVYKALLEENPLTAYETANQAGIPSSKIYSVIKKLEEKELVLELIEKSKKRYIPQEAEEYITSYRHKMEKTLNTLSEELKHPLPKKEVSYVWNMTQRASILERAEKIIDRSRESLMISLWADEFEILAPLIQQKEKEGIQIAVIHFGPVRKTGIPIFEHPIQDTLYEEKGGRGFTLVCDGSVALSATFSERESEGAWSRGQGFVTLAEDYIKHDIYIMKIVKRFDKDLVKTFGEGYALLRDIYNDEECGGQ